MRTTMILFLALFTATSQAQNKIEIEKSVKTDKVPQSAVEDLDAILGDNHKVKWYYQEDGTKKVYEAKFKYNSKEYSVEFDTTGVIFNVEIKVNYDELSPKFISKLEKKLDQLFDDYKIRKIQIEYLGKKEDLFELLSTQEVDEDLQVQYEIEINAKSEKSRTLYELIYDNKVKLLSKRKIKLRSTDILDY